MTSTLANGVIVTPLITIFGVYAVYKLLVNLYERWSSPLNILPGPKSSSIIFGNLREIWDAEAMIVHEKWAEEYGSTIRYSGFMGVNRLYTTDVKAINHILMNDHIYQKPEAGRYNLAQIVGEGVLVVEGEKHKQQRKIMNPAFGGSQIRELTEIFVEKAIELRDAWSAEISKESSDGRVEVLSWLSKMTLDVIGLAGFNYKFNALSGNENQNELNKAFSTIFKTTTRMSMVPVVRGLVPLLRWLPAEGDSARKVAVKTMDRIGKQLLRDSKARILLDEGEKGKVGKDSLKGRDLLSLLLRANMSDDLPPSARMSDEDVLAQVPTFLVAGHETTSTATTWALYLLSQHPEVQFKLREELFTVGTDNPTMDELNALPYLDAVVREVLRITPPVPSSMRQAARDDVIPLGQPIKDKYGNFVDSIRIRKGQHMFIPILALNRQKSIWGEDAGEFRPERWQHVPPSAASIPGIWGNMMTFLGGPRACIGYRFSLVETKALLFTLIRAFEFELAVPLEDISKRSGIVQRPYLKSNPKAGNQLPCILKPVNRN